MMAILAGMLLPALQKARNKARDISCRNNQRQVNIALVLYHDTYNMLPQTYDGTNFWMYYVYKAKFVPECKVGKTAIWLCPAGEGVAAPIFNGYFDKSYGFAAYFNDVKLYSGSVQNNIIFGKIKNPSDWPLFSDSFKSSNNTQVYMVFKDYGNWTCLRHSKKANLTYLDGHVNSENYNSLQRFYDVRCYCDRNHFRYAK